MTFKLKFLYFAKLKEIIQKQSQEIILENDNENKFEIYNSESRSVYNTHNKLRIKIRDLFEIVKKGNKQFESELEKLFISCLLSINDEYINNDLEMEIELNEEDEISILPPISAG
jgi:molybdopterin converting factor small subunit